MDKLQNIDDVKIIKLPKFLDARGNLSFVEQLNHIPFEIKRTYWIYDVPGGENRGGHAYLKNNEFIIALSGAFDVIVDDGRQKKIYAQSLLLWTLCACGHMARDRELFN